MGSIGPYVTLPSTGQQRSSGSSQFIEVGRALGDNLY